MSEKLDNLIDSINRYLKNQNLAPIAGTPKDVISLYEAALRSVWKLPDREKRDVLAVELAKGLQKFAGGKSIEAAYQELSQKLTKEEQAALKKAEADNTRQAREARMKDPNYIPSFDELMNS